MGEYEKCWLDTNAALYSTEEFLRQSRNAQQTFGLQFASSDHIIGNRKGTLTSTSADGKSTLGEMAFAEPWFCNISATGSNHGKADGADQKFQTTMFRPGLADYWNSFENATKDSSGHVIQITKGEFTRNFFSPDEINTKITDANGNLLLSSQSTIRSPWLFGTRSIDTIYKDGNGHPLGESHTNYYQHKGGPTIELVGGLMTIGGVSQICMGRAALGLRLGLVGAGITALGYFWPRTSFETTFKRY